MEGMVGKFPHESGRPGLLMGDGPPSPQRAGCCLRTSRWQRGVFSWAWYQVLMYVGCPPSLPPLPLLFKVVQIGSS